MADRVRRVYRALAYYPDGSGGEYIVRRHFQTARARDRWAAGRREGYPAVEGRYMGAGEYDDRPALKPALRVEVADSDPVVFPVDACRHVVGTREGCAYGMCNGTPTHGCGDCCACLQACRLRSGQGAPSGA